MKYSFVLLALVVGVLASFNWYCTAMLDWMLDILTGVYAQNPVEAFLETAFLGGYIVLATRFFLRKLVDLK
jgi:hypothetical protein